MHGKKIPRAHKLPKRKQKAEKMN